MSGKESAGYAEIVDSINDVLDVFKVVADKLKDGFQFYDAYALLEIYPKLQEVYNDRNKLLTELRDLDAAEAEAVYQDVATIRGEKVTGLESKFILALDIVSDVYETVERAKSTYVKITMLVKAKAA